MKRKSRNVIITIAILLAVAYVGFGLSYFLILGDARGSCGSHAVNRPDKIVFTGGWPPVDLSPYAITRYEMVRFPSRQPGLSIAGWWAEAKPGAPAVIMVHGAKGCKNAADVLVPAGMLWRNGFNVLLIDVREVGDSDSEDGWSSAGNEESKDVLGAWDWLVATKGYAPERVGLLGVSLGGAATLHAFQDEPRVAALFLESTFSNLVETVAYQMKGYGVAGFLSRPSAYLYHLVTGEDILARSPIAAIRTAGDRQVYIVHSQPDRRVSISQGEELAAAALDAGVKVNTWFPERGGHLQIPVVYPEECELRLVGFFRGALGE